MGENTKIQWAHHTFNAWIGCEKISEACKFCYAETYSTRWGIAEWGKTGTRYRTVQSNWNKLLRWNRMAAKDRQRRRVFCFSLSDIMEDHPMIPQSWREEFYNIVKQCDWLDFLFLTKRPENYSRFLPKDWGEGYDNVWLGCSVENQRRYDERVAHMAAIPAKIKFFSMEPLLGHVQMNWMPDWIIIGGESGFKKDCRQMDLRSVLSVFNQAEGKNVKVFFKQTGTLLASIHKMKRDNKGGDFDDYPEGLSWLKVRQVPTSLLELPIEITGPPLKDETDNQLNLLI
jgi:protein gp37